MPRYIDADWITQNLEGWQDKLAETYGKNDEYVLCLGEVLMKLDDTPTADVVERKVGKWIISEMPVTGAIEHRCSECDTPYYMGFCFQMNYCPNCGAEMEKGESDAKQS